MFTVKDPWPVSGETLVEPMLLKHAQEGVYECPSYKTFYAIVVRTNAGGHSVLWYNKNSGELYLGQPIDQSSTIQVLPTTKRVHLSIR